MYIIFLSSIILYSMLFAWHYIESVQISDLSIAIMVTVTGRIYLDAPFFSEMFLLQLIFTSS